MKKLLFILAASALVSTVAAQNCSQPRDFIEVKGSAFVMVTPNKAEISITLNQADSKGKLSMSELESQLATALKQAGVDAAKQLVLSDQSSEAQKRNKAYQYKSYILTVSSAVEAQNIFDAFASNSINNASVTKVWNDKQKEIVDTLKVEAMLDAQSTAKTLAAAIGQKVGAAIQITDFSYTPVFSQVSSNFMARKASSSDAVESLPTLDFKSIRIERSVNVKFAL